MAIANLPPRAHPTLLTRHHHSPAKSNFPTSFLILRNPNPSFSSSSTTVVTFASSSSSSSSWEQEEQRWLREEQRWLREEQRWLREERRWSSEREALLSEIAALRLRIDALEGERSPLAHAVEAVLVAAKERRLIAGAENIIVEEDVVKEMLEEGIRMPEEGEKEVLKENKVVNEKKERKTLRMGSEGEDVREMQEALQMLGFYSGEDDMEYSSFSTGTDRAVKTWQASLGATENGIMTSELLEKLFVELYLNDSNKKGIADDRKNMTPIERKDGTNGAPIASVRKFAEIQEETLIKEAGDTEIGISQHRVFLLGENRWEEPSRLQGRNKPSEASKASSPTWCLTCRGEGRLMCSECDGTGEPNIEPQFLEWVDEGAKCPYCEGLGYIICEVCEGKNIFQN